MTIEQITQLIIQYAPVVASFILVIFNIAKTLKGFKIIDINPPMNSLKSELNNKYNSLTQELRAVSEENKNLKEISLAAQDKCVELEAKLVEAEEKLVGIVSDQNDKLTKLVQNDLDIKAEVRRIK